MSINRKFASFIQDILMSRSVHSELRDVFNVVLNIVWQTVEEHIRAPFNEERSGDRRVKHWKDEHWKDASS